jgi:hypothetical protein
MKKLYLVIISILTLLTFSCSKDEPSNEEMIIGSWSLVKEVFVDSSGAIINTSGFDDCERQTVIIFNADTCFLTRFALLGDNCVEFPIESNYTIDGDRIVISSIPELYERIEFIEDRLRMGKVWEDGTWNFYEEFVRN